MAGPEKPISVVNAFHAARQTAQAVAPRTSFMTRPVAAPNTGTHNADQQDPVAWWASQLFSGLTSVVGDNGKIIHNSFSNYIRMDLTKYSGLEPYRSLDGPDGEFGQYQYRKAVYDNIVSLWERLCRLPTKPTSVQGAENVQEWHASIGFTQEEKNLFLAPIVKMLEEFVKRLVTTTSGNALDWQTLLWIEGNMTGEKPAFPDDQADAVITYMGSIATLKMVTGFNEKKFAADLQLIWLSDFLAAQTAIDLQKRKNLQTAVYNLYHRLFKEDRVEINVASKCFTATMQMVEELVRNRGQAALTINNYMNAFADDLPHGTYTYIRRALLAVVISATIFALLVLVQVPVASITIPAAYTMVTLTSATMSTQILGGFIIALPLAVLFAADLIPRFAKPNSDKLTQVELAAKSFAGLRADAVYEKPKRETSTVIATNPMHPSGMPGGGLGGGLPGSSGAGGLDWDRSFCDAPGGSGEAGSQSGVVSSTNPLQAAARSTR